MTLSLEGFNKVEGLRRSALLSHALYRPVLIRASKSPCTSMVTSEICFPRAQAAVGSAPDRLGRTPPCCGLSILWVIAVHVIMHVTVHCRPLPRHERRAIGRQERGGFLSFFPTLGIIETSASFQIVGN